MRIRTPLAAVVLSLAGLSAAAAGADEDRYWPQWRGPLGTGEAPLAKPPVEWSETKNVRWKIPVPGIGKSTPVVWDDLVIVTSAVPSAKELRAPGSSPASSHPQVAAAGSGFEFVVLAYGRRDGQLRWRRAVKEEKPHEGLHKDGTYASGSALTDGKRIYAFFGSRGLYALDMKGRVLWQKELGLHADAQLVRRGRVAGAPRRHARRHLGPRGGGLHRRARRRERTGEVAEASATSPPPGRRRSWSSTVAARRWWWVVPTSC